MPADFIRFVAQVAEAGMKVKGDDIRAAIEACGNANTNTQSAYYVAIEGTSCAISTCGGCKVNENMQVERDDGSVIENLFMVGTDSLGNLMATGCDYPLGGHAAMWAISSGNLAGRKAIEVSSR